MPSESLVVRTKSIAYRFGGSTTPEVAAADKSRVEAGSEARFYTREGPWFARMHEDGDFTAACGGRHTGVAALGGVALNENEDVDGTRYYARPR